MLLRCLRHHAGDETVDIDRSGERALRDGVHFACCVLAGRCLTVTLLVVLQFIMITQVLDFVYTETFLPFTALPHTDA